MSKRPVNKVVRVPVVIQMEALECGAACLAMVLAYYKKWIPLEKVRSDCGVSRDGSRASNIVKAARNYHLKTQAYRMEPEQLRQAAQFPCIIHWNFNHFVVVRGFRGNYAYLNDPAEGEVRITIDDFDEGFTGVCIFFEPDEAFEPGGQKKNVFNYIRKHGGGLKGIAIFAVTATLTGAMINLIEPGFTRMFFDRLLSGKNKDWLIPFVIAFCALTAVKIAFTWVETLGNLKANGKLDAVASTSFMWKVLRLPMVFFSQRMSGDVLSRQESGSRIANTIIQTFAPLILQIATMVIWFIAMIRYSVSLTLIGLVSVCIEAIISRVLTKKQMNVIRASMKDQGNLAGYTVNGISMIETIKASGSEEGFFERWSGYQAGANDADVKYARFGYRASVASGITSTICDVTILFVSMLLISRGGFTIGKMNAFMIYLGNFLTPVGSLIDAFKEVQQMQTEIDRVEDVMEYPEDPVFTVPKSDEKETLRKLSGEIDIKGLTFGYSPLEPPLISNLDLHIRAGGSLALVGGSGSGKSTIGKLISGLYQPWEGEILFDGKTVLEIDRAVFNGSLSVVDQDITLFNDTIRNNICMWDNAIEDFEMILAARDAQIHEDILQRENGYDYVLTEDGKDFSGGQRQRLEIARVLAQDPTICILDEATSALDAQTEHAVVQAIRDRGITCVIIAHRLSTIRDCDEILVLDHGKVAERGTHEQLIAKHGLYNELVTSD